jgi:protoporphyrinogen oxidase
MNRRDFLVVSAATGTLSLLPSWARAHNITPGILKNFTADDLSPVQRLSALRGSNVIEGDTFDEAHEIFWNKEGYIQKKGGIPASSQNYDVVIVGAGIAGLTAAYYLPNKKILLLDGNPRMGGNSKSQTNGKSWMSQGAAYLGENEEGGEIDQFLASLGIKKYIRRVEGDPVAIKGKIYTRFWEGESDPSRAAEFEQFYKRLYEIYENELPELPLWDMANRSSWDSLDRTSFAEWIKREFGEIHPHIMEMVTLYCWSSFSASPSEISAAHGLYFFANDTCGTPMVFPGGNGFIAQAMYDKIKARSNVTIKGGAFAVDIKVVSGRAQVCYKNGEKLETVTATKCIAASPKKVMRFVISGLDPAQDKAMNEIPYRAYLVANLILKKKIASRGYDMYTLEGHVPTSEYNEITQRTFTDIVFADWASKDNVDQSALTLYLPLPYDMAQQYLFIDGLYQKYENRIKSKIPALLTSLGLSWADVEGWRLVRYGHSMPVARTGYVANGNFERASKDIGGCIFFANQDNWGNPCFETAWKSAVEAVKKIR